jgi:glycosyltransferase involved in cell wall biosynthesis
VVRNNATTLLRTIDSVQGQTYPNVEHIVVDGASTDGTLDNIRQRDDQIDYFVSEPDAGLYDAINKAVPLARGQLICVVNSDDWLEPDAAEIAVQRLADHRSNQLLLTAAQVRTEDGGVEWYPDFVHPGSYFKCANVCHNGIYATRSAYEKSGPYDAAYRIAADFKWIMTCLDAGAAFTYTREVTVNYSLGGLSGDGRQQSLECMQVVRDRFPTLTEAEICGLHDCFFAFRAIDDLPDRPADRTAFLRGLFARNSFAPDVLQALAWACLGKLEYPSSPAEPASAPDPKFSDWVRGVLRTRPLGYRIAARIYSAIS